MYHPSDNVLFTYGSHSNSLQAICLFTLYFNLVDQCYYLCEKRFETFVGHRSSSRRDCAKYKSPGAWSRLPLPIPRDPRRENVAPDVSHGICCQLKHLFQIQNTVWSIICKGFRFCSFLPRRFNSNDMDFIIKI